MIDWNALAEQHEYTPGTANLERTVMLLCREMAQLVPQEMAEPGEMRLVDARADMAAERMAPTPRIPNSSHW